MTELAIIGGSGVTRLESLDVIRLEKVETPYGAPSAPLVHGVYRGHELLFIPRHGVGHTILPHRVNYRANIWALKQHRPKGVLGIAAVGGIHPEMGPESIVIPDQIIDYTYGRKHTFFEDDLSQVTHIDFTRPYCEELRSALIASAAARGIEILTSGTYGATQGPRLETAGEISRMERDGCDLVGMTGMPEAALARELELCYASCCVVANWAAGRGGEEITMEEIERHLESGMSKVYGLIEEICLTF